MSEMVEIMKDINDMIRRETIRITLNAAPVRREIEKLSRLKVPKTRNYVPYEGGLE